MALFFFKQKTAYELRISDWSSDVCSSDLAQTQPGRQESFAAVLRYDALDRGLIGLRGGGAERQRHVGKTEFEEPVAPPGLAVVVALRHRAGEDLDLAVVESEATVDRGDLRLDRALVRTQQPGLAAPDGGGGDPRAVAVGMRLGGEDRSEEHTSELHH